LLCAKLLNWKKYSSFKIVYGLTLLDLISLLIDERVRFDDKRKAQVMKALLYNNILRKRMRSTHFKQTKDEKGLSLNRKIGFGCICVKRDFVDIKNQS